MIQLKYKSAHILFHMALLCDCIFGYFNVAPAWNALLIDIHILLVFSCSPIDPSSFLAEIHAREAHLCPIQ